MGHARRARPSRGAAPVNRSRCDRQPHSYLGRRARLDERDDSRQLVAGQPRVEQAGHALGGGQLGGAGHAPGGGRRGGRGPEWRRAALAPSHFPPPSVAPSPAHAPQHARFDHAPVGQGPGRGLRAARGVEGAGEQAEGPAGLRPPRLGAWAPMRRSKGRWRDAARAPARAAPRRTLAAPRSRPPRPRPPRPPPRPRPGPAARLHRPTGSRRAP